MSFFYLLIFSRDARQKSKGKISFLGGYDPKNKELEMFPMEANSAKQFCQTMSLIRMKFLTKGIRELLVISDNVSWHKAKITQ
jgi:hypothetical protein